MKSIIYSLILITNRALIAIMSGMILIIWLAVALINFSIFIASGLAVISYILSAILSGKWLSNLSYLFGLEINTETWQIITIHGWFYIFAFSSFLMRYFPLFGNGIRSKRIYNFKPKQISETKNVFVAPPKIG